MSLISEQARMEHTMPNRRMVIQPPPLPGANVLARQEP